jgi:hypothetical protein
MKKTLRYTLANASRVRIEAQDTEWAKPFETLLVNDVLIITVLIVFFYVIIFAIISFLAMGLILMFIRSSIESRLAVFLLWLPCSRTSGNVGSPKTSTTNCAIDIPRAHDASNSSSKIQAVVGE